jgi:hypothetical protein
MSMRSFLFSVLIAGVVLGVLGNLPVLNLINCALCIFVWVGGALAVILYRSFEHGKAIPTIGQAAGMGAVAGIIGDLVGVVVYLVTSPISNPMFNALARYLQYEGEPPFGTGNLGTYIGSAFVFLIIDAVLYPLFGALGAMLAASIMKKPAAVE